MLIFGDSTYMCEYECGLLVHMCLIIVWPRRNEDRGCRLQAAGFASCPTVTVLLLLLLLTFGSPSYAVTADQPHLHSQFSH
jgi:hypothetical protein